LMSGVRAIARTTLYVDGAQGLESNSHLKT